MQHREIEQEPCTDTMLYRAERSDSEPGSVTDIWGRRLETVIVDESEVEAKLAEGWVRHPSQIEGFKDEKVQADRATAEAKSDAAALQEAADALAAANQREAELKEELQQAIARAEAAEAEVAEMKELIAAFDGDGDGKPGGSKKKAS